MFGVYSNSAFNVTVHLIFHVPASDMTHILGCQHVVIGAPRCVCVFEGGGGGRGC